MSVAPSGAKCPRQACVLTRDKVEQNEVGSKSGHAVQLSLPLI